MKRFLSLLIFITLTLIILLNSFSNISFSATAKKTNNVKRNSNSYWSLSNAPMFYGATKITIKKGLIDKFDVLDSRFRIFAKDFEDGDLTPKIQYSGEVNINEVNTYEITYKVTDSHNNTTTLVVPVIVTDDENTKIIVERTLYTTPSVWNMDLAEFSRCNYGDRQMLGVFLKENQSIKARVISSETDFRIDYMNNNSLTESHSNLLKSGDWFTIENNVNNISYDAVPLLRTPVLSKSNTQINKIYKIELQFDETISPLNYYHYKDNEETYKNNWLLSQNSFSVIESETLLLVVPLTDINYMTNYYANGFKSLDKFLEYYQKVVEKMDEYVGLDFNPTKITDQNVRTKYLIKANSNGIGAAYYAGDHVGVNNASMKTFFEMNWGGLHELAHGYQGSLGKGEMLLGEVSNNILGYYIQTDKSLYDRPGNWLGELPIIEEEKNSGRLSGKNFSEIDTTVRLYMIINLLDTFEKGTTYSKMFSWYREQLNNGRTMTNQDAYVEAIADIYNINIIPYMEAWGLNISVELKNKMFNLNYPLINILADMVSPNLLNTIMTNENLSKKYSLVKNDILKKNNVKSNLSLEIQIDDISKLVEKILLLKDGKNIIEKYKIENSTIELANIPVGTYYLQMPILNGYSQELIYIQVSENSTNYYSYTYENLEETTFDNYLKLQLLGYNYDTIAFQLKFKNNYNKVEISYPNQSKMSGNESVIIYNYDGSIISQNYTTGGYFDKKSYIIDAYNQLRDIDKEPFTDLINAIKRGGIPQITINTDNLEFDLGTSIDLYSLIKATDNEDGNIDIDKTSTKIITDFNAEKPGIYDIKYEVSDSDNNIATYTLQITILESEENNKDEDNGITNPPAVDDDNESDNDAVPPTSDDENSINNESTSNETPDKIIIEHSDIENSEGNEIVEIPKTSKIKFIFIILVILSICLTSFLVLKIYKKNH